MQSRSAPGCPPLGPDGGGQHPRVLVGKRPTARLHCAARAKLTVSVALGNFKIRRQPMRWRLHQCAGPCKASNKGAQQHQRRDQAGDGLPGRPIKCACPAVLPSLLRRTGQRQRACPASWQSSTATAPQLLDHRAHMVFAHRHPRAGHQQVAILRRLARRRGGHPVVGQDATIHHLAAPALQQAGQHIAVAVKDMPRRQILRAMLPPGSASSSPVEQRHPRPAGHGQLRQPQAGRQPQRRRGQAQPGLQRGAAQGNVLPANGPCCGTASKRTRPYRPAPCSLPA